jgi:hypothetical protein
MSRGLGRIERQIAEWITVTKSDSHGCILIRSGTLTLHCPSRSGIKFLRARRKSVVRAMHSFVRKFPEYALLGGQGRKPLFLYELADPDSVAWAQASVATKGVVLFSDVVGIRSFQRWKRVALVEKKIPRIGVLEKKVPRLH